tara:strand:+ start:3847 stop:4005 length:159 start_codon:yes stop_codon:yes gene_type:complete
MKGIKMELKKVLKTIEKIEIKLKNQGMVQDERLLNHLDNLNQIAFELIKKEK